MNEKFKRIIKPIQESISVERKAYEQSVKYYRDLKNVIDTSHEEGIVKGREKEKDKSIRNGITKGYSNETIADFTNRSIKEIQEIRQKLM